MGEGYDFAELNIYTLGDDAKKIDWKSTARTSIPHIKSYYQEKESSVVLIPILTQTLKFRDKFELLLKSCTLIGYDAVSSFNRVKPLLFCNNSYQNFPPSKDIGSIDHFIKKLSRCNLDKNNFDIDKISKHTPSKSLIFIIGDFLEIPDLKSLTQKNEVVAIIIRDSFEEHPTPLGERDFIDLDTHKTKSIFFGKKEAKRYQKAFKEHDKLLFKQFRSLSIKTFKIVSNEPILKQLYKQLSIR